MGIGEGGGRKGRGVWKVGEEWAGRGERGKGDYHSFVAIQLLGLGFLFFRPAETDFVLYKYFSYMFRPIECVARRLDDPGYFADIKTAARSQMA